MKPKQFRRLAGLSKIDRVDLVVEGLQKIGANVASLAAELARCDEVKAFRAGDLAYNAAREEAGKFLILIDVWRAPGISQKLRSRQFERAGDHLSKLIYAQMADYSIASQEELLKAIDMHRARLYLDGPNDYDWIYRNSLLWERESAMYVDLVDSEGKLEWSTPPEYRMSVSATYSILLVQALLNTNLVSAAGLHALQDAWRGFDPKADSHCSDWTRRTAEALASFPETNVQDGRLNESASFVARQWPMPMVELEVDEDAVSTEDLQARRDQAREAWMRTELGSDQLGLG